MTHDGAAPTAGQGPERPATSDFEVAVKSGQWHLLGAGARAMCGAFAGQHLYAVGVYPDFSRLVCLRCLSVRRDLRGLPESEAAGPAPPRPGRGRRAYGPRLPRSS